MAYSSTNPVYALTGGGLSGGTDVVTVWAYKSTHAHGDIIASEFFTGVAGYGGVGMKAGDLLVNINHSTAGTSAVTWHPVTSVTTSTGARSARNATVGAAAST